MTLEKEVRRLMEEGYKDSEKDEEKMLEVRRFYAEEHDWQRNYARQHYECMFNLSCRQAEELNMDLWVYLSNSFKIPKEERHFLKPPAKLKNKKEMQDCIKWLFYPFFFEWMFNDFANPIIYAFSKDLLTLREGGKKRGEQETQGKVTRQEIIIQKARELDVKKLLADGMMKKDIDKLVADAIPEEKKKKAAGIQYVRKLLKSLNYNP